MVTFAIIGIVLDTVGTVLIAYAALKVHSRIRHEHRIDAAVWREMKHENIAGVVGIFLMILGNALHIYAL